MRPSLVLNNGKLKLNGCELEPSEALTLATELLWALIRTKYITPDEAQDIGEQIALAAADD